MVRCLSLPYASSMRMCLQFQRPEVNAPDSIVDLLETNVLTDADGGHVHPAAVPPDTAIGTDVAGFEAIGTLGSGQRRRQSVRMRRDQAHRDADDVEAGPHRTP